MKETTGEEQSIPTRIQGETATYLTVAWDYRDLSAVAACICLQQWNDSTLVLESAIEIRDVEPYEPGRFYRRELPRIVCASRVLETV